MLQKRTPLTALSPNMCIMCGLDSELGAHLFLHCPMVNLFGLGFLVSSLENHGLALWIHISFYSLTLEVLTCIKKA